MSFTKTDYITYHCDMCGAETQKKADVKYWAYITWNQHDDWCRHWRSTLDLCSVCAEAVINFIEGKK